jgi:hypothetical protein
MSNKMSNKMSNTPCALSNPDDIEYISELSKKYKNELEACIFSYNSCPDTNVKNKLNIRISELRNICSELSDKISKYNSIVTDYERLSLYDHNDLTDEMIFNLEICKKQNQDIKNYNLILKTANIFDMCMETLYNKLKN